jgi:REP element-mobilizing transposase RayT
MPRVKRVFFDGAVYHVYNRLARGERVFASDRQTLAFVELLREVTARDDVSVFAWVVLPNHYHMSLQTGAVPLARTMKTLQWRTSRRVNTETGVAGPLWQGRYQAKLVEDQRYLDRLLAYIHLNPVVAGLAEDPAKYRWSGHRDILGLRKRPIVDVDAVLRLFGTARRSARTAYARAIRGAGDAPWIGEDPGHLPWWRLGRPPRRDEDDPDASGRAKREADSERQRRERPRLDAEAFAESAVAAIGIGIEEIRGRGKGREVSRARELLATLGVERYGLRVKDLAECLSKHPVTVTSWVMRGVRRRSEDPDTEAQLEALDRYLCSQSGPDR